MKKFILIIMLLFSTVFLGQLRGETIGKELIVHANVLNLGTRNAEDLRVTVYIPELAFFHGTNRFDLDDGEKTGKFVFGYLNNALPGVYLTKVTLSSDDGVLDAKYTYTII